MRISDLPVGVQLDQFGGEEYDTFYQNPSKTYIQTSLVVQWLGVCLPMQQTGVNLWSRKIPHTKEQLSPRAELLKPVHLEPVLHNRSHCNEKPRHHHKRKPWVSNEDPEETKKN